MQRRQDGEALEIKSLWKEGSIGGQPFFSRV